jgi:glycosyltransferase involved in cell wall biosynthesis
MLDSVTPILLTFNEERNIGRTLSRLSWANDVVVVDSGSSDDTVDILNSCDNVRMYSRKFDDHSSQWQFALEQTGIETEWVLALDADYLLSPDLVDELKNLVPVNGVNGYSVSFGYCIDGKPVRGSLYPPVCVLYRRESADYIQQGHTQRIRVDGKTSDLKSLIYHDDRKPFSFWFQSQVKYAGLEKQLIRSTCWQELSLSNRLRKLIVVTPILVPVYILIIKGAVLSGIPGFKYAGQRLIAEALLSYQLLFK